MKIINQKEDTIKFLRRMLAIKDEEIRKLEENNLALQREKLVIEERKDVEINELREVITEKYKFINNLLPKSK